MTLPEQIRKQTEAVQELYKQMNDDTGTQQNTEGANDQVGNTTAQDTANAANTSLVSEEASPPPANEPTAGEKSRKSEDNQTLAQKYKTLQGMYNAEVPRLHQQNRELASRVQQMEQLLATLSASAANTSIPGQITQERLISDKDVEEYGESLEVMRKVSREEYLPMLQKIASLEQIIQRLQGNVVPQVQELVQRQAASTEQQFWAQLSSVVPNWKAINDDPDFQTWLLQVDPLTGISRQTILEDAQRNFDVVRITNFFRAWTEISGQNTQRSNSASELERQVSPGRSRGGTPGASLGGNSKTYTPNDIRSFFDAVRQGQYKGREQERDRIERDIFAAQREGRIVANT